jgi:site-specific recombinase XerC
LVPTTGATAITGTRTIALPRLIAEAGPTAADRFLEFFAAQLANDQTRAAYGRAARQFLAWCETRGLTLRALAPLHVAAYIRTHRGSVPTVKQHLAAIRVLCDWLVVSQILPTNPAAAVRGPKHRVTTGTTPVLTAGETRILLDRIPTGTIVGLRDRALIGVMVYSFARVSAVVGMRRQDYFPQGKRWWLRLDEKGGKRHAVPAHHLAEAYLDAYLAGGALADPKVPLFQSVDRARRLTGRALGRREVLAMIKRRAAAAALPGSTAVTRSGRPGSRRISRTAGPSSTHSGLPRTLSQRRRSCTIGPPTPSPSMKLNAL